jgi:hypothetical protein
MHFVGRLKTLLAVTGAIALVGILPDLAAAQTLRFQQTKSQGCFIDFDNRCEVSFLVPTGELREIHTVSCSATVAPNSAPIQNASLVAFNQAGTPLALHHLVPFRNGTTAGVSFNTMNHQLLLFAPAGGKFLATVITNGGNNISLSCSISGHRIKP